MRVLVVNAGSSTLKLRVVADGGAVDAAVDVDPWGGDPETAGAAVDRALEGLPAVGAVGHRVVHGGRHLVAATEATPEVTQEIADLVPLAPLHQPRALAGLDAARERLPGVPQVACFDTAFHATLPPAARTYALPAAWRSRWGLDRHGFHGLSHAWAARRASSLVGAGHPTERVVTCHLGAGASLCAVRGGSSVDTTMGFTPLEGLVMATRSGTVDPGLVLWLLTDGRLDPEEVSVGLERDGGLAGLSGTSGDMREVLRASAAGDASAALAFDVYVHRLRREIAAMAAALGGLDVLVFTGGVGERGPIVRAAAAAGLGFLGIGVDAAGNEAATGDADISDSASVARTLVVTSREDLQIADEVRALLEPAAAH